MKKYIALLLIIILSTSNLCGCGDNTEQIIASQNALNEALLEIEDIHQDLNTLDVNAADAVDTALTKLSALNQAFTTLANVKIADESYAYVTDLAEEGAEYMSQAYKLFEEAYRANEFAEETADLAYKYLERATTRVRVIVSMLHGVVPDGVTVH